MKKFVNLITTAIMSVGLTAGVGSAGTISLGGIDYEMSMMDGALNDNRALIEDQVWWGDQLLALDFAKAWGANSDLLVGSSSPFFAFGDLGPSIFAVTQYLTINDSAGTFNALGTSVKSFAFVSSSAPSVAVSAVPLPAGGLLMLTGLAGLAGLRRKAKRA